MLHLPQSEVLHFPCMEAPPECHDFERGLLLQGLDSMAKERTQQASTVWEAKGSQRGPLTSRGLAPILLNPCMLAKGSFWERDSHSQGLRPTLQRDPSGVRICRPCHVLGA